MKELQETKQTDSKLDSKDVMDAVKVLAGLGVVGLVMVAVVDSMGMVSAAGVLIAMIAFGIPVALLTVPGVFVALVALGHIGALTLTGVPGSILTYKMIKYFLNQGQTKAELIDEVQNMPGLNDKIKQSVIDKIEKYEEDGDDNDGNKDDRETD